MPIFEYACDDCGQNFEKLVRNSNKADILCPTCSSDAIHKKLSTFATNIKGAVSVSSSGGGAAASCAPGGL